MRPIASTSTDPAPRRATFTEDFRRFFTRGLAALLPTLITLWLLVWLWNFLWESLGIHIIQGIKNLWLTAGAWGLLPEKPAAYIGRYWSDALNPFRTKFVGVLLAILLVYILGLFLGNLIGRTLYRILEQAVMKIPLVRAIYPAAKQVTDFLLVEKKAGEAFQASRVVAVHARDPNVWSIGLITGNRGIKALDLTTREEMLTVFLPSSPTAFSGYVVVVPRSAVVDLPITVEDAMRMLLSGGVIGPEDKPAIPAPAAPVTAQ